MNPVFFRSFLKLSLGLLTVAIGYAGLTVIATVGEEWNRQAFERVFRKIDVEDFVAARVSSAVGDKIVLTDEMIARLLASLSKRGLSEGLNAVDARAHSFLWNRKLVLTRMAGAGSFWSGRVDGKRMSGPIGGVLRFESTPRFWAPWLNFKAKPWFDPE